MDSRRNGTASWMLLAGVVVLATLILAWWAGPVGELGDLPLPGGSGSPSFFLLQAVACLVTGVVFHDFAL